MKGAIKVLCLLSVLPACSNYEPLRPEIGSRIPPSRYDEIAYINTLRAALVVTANSICFNGEGLKPFDQTYSQGDPINYRLTEEGNHCVRFSDPAPERPSQAFADRLTVSPSVVASPAAPPSVRRYLDAGFGLSDIYCERFFVVAAGSQANRRFARDTVSNVQTLVSSILSLASAGDIATGVAAGALGSVENTFNDYDGAFLVDPDMGQVRELVLATQAQFRSIYIGGEQLPNTFEAARSVIERYAGICTFTSMRRMIATALEISREELVASLGPSANGSQQSPEIATDTNDEEGSTGQTQPLPPAGATTPIPTAGSGGDAP